MGFKSEIGQILRGMLIVFAGALTLLFSYTVSAQEPAALHQVTLQWVPLRGADHYEIVIVDEHQSLLPVRFPKVVSSRLVVKLAPGEYRYRIRGVDEFGRPGEWSSSETLEIAKTVRSI